MKYIASRTVGINVANSYAGSLRNFVLSAIGPTIKPAPISTGHGLASIIGTSSHSQISCIQSIDGESSIDEERELSKLTETLTECILQCCHFDVHNRALELQIEWLQNNANKNSLTIDRMFRQEIQTAQQLIEDATRSKPDMEKKLHDIHQTTIANDEHYQQLLSRRNTTNRDIFEYHRQLAQTRAESEFLRCRIQQFNDEIQFYTLKNESLQLRKTKLHYEVDEEIFAKQVLKTEVEVLESEKISNEDVHSIKVDDIRGSIDMKLIATSQPLTYFREQLTHEIRRSRVDYERKIQTYRDELHRQYELELHRYHMHKHRPIPNVTREHEQKIDQLKHERKIVEQQISAVSGSIHEVQIQIQTFEKQITERNTDSQAKLSTQRHLAMLEQIIREREKQHDDAIRIRTELKQRIEIYREELNRYSKRTLENSSTTKRKSILRSSSEHDIKRSNYHSSTFIQVKSPSLQDIHKTKDSISFEGTITRFTDFDVEQDCKRLNHIFDQMHIDETAIIRILCNRTVAQRIRIRDIYKNLFNKGLINVIDTNITDDSKKILKILLLSPIERNCYELRRIFKNANLDENILIEIFLTSTNKQIKHILDYYNKLFESTVEQDIMKNRNTPSIKIFLALLQANRPEDDTVDEDEVCDDAKNLAESQSKWRTDGSTFIRLLCNRSNAHLKQTFAVYHRYSNVDIEDSIKTSANPDLSRTLMAIVRIIRNSVRFFAYELKKSLKGSSTNEDNLTRIIVSRSEIDMLQIKAEFEKITHRTLFDHIQTDTKGNYRRALLELLRQRIEPINKEMPFPQLLDPPRRYRPTVQWKDSVSKQREIYTTRRFDRNNQAKSTTISTIPIKPFRTRYHEQESYSNDNHDNEE
ncbi:hypothetical protein I4U23_014466 [Adineta vaga]|nr:hypothetical protein I4U23_014466 [Adineta vaga]